MRQKVGFAEFLGEMSLSAYRELGCEAVLFVEGTNDVKAVTELLRVLGDDHKVAVLPLGGGSLIHKDRQIEVSEIGRLGERVYALIDSERKSEAREGPWPAHNHAREAPRVHGLHAVCVEGGMTSPTG